jgi:ABC-type multidrug transport system fused ATPase/permease subunit
MRAGTAGRRKRLTMPLSEDEQRILREIEENLSATDPKLVQQVSDNTLYRHSARMIKWSVVGFLAGLALLLVSFTKVLLLGVLGFLVMLMCLLVIERNVRKLGRAGLESLTSSMRNGALKGMLGNASKRWRERWGRDEPPAS